MENVMLSAKQILDIDDTKREYVDCSPEWPGGVYAQSLTAHQRDNLETSPFIMDEDTGKVTKRSDMNVRAMMVFYGAVDALGLRVFENIDDVELLGEKNSLPMDKIATKVRELSGMMPGAVKDRVKNSSSDQP